MVTDEERRSVEGITTDKDETVMSPIPFVCIIADDVSVFHIDDGLVVRDDVATLDIKAKDVER